MKTSQLLKILNSVPGNTEIYLTGSDDPSAYIMIHSVDVEHPGDEEGELCVNILVDLPKEED